MSLNTNVVSTLRARGRSRAVETWVAFVTATTIARLSEVSWQRNEPICTGGWFCVAGSRTAFDMLSEAVVLRLICRQPVSSPPIECPNTSRSMTHSSVLWPKRRGGRS